MIFPDLNLLLYAHNTAFEDHDRCAAWLDSLMNGKQRVCFSWHTILGFVRITTTRRMFPAGYTSNEALQIPSEFLDSPNSVLISPGEQHFAIMRNLIENSGISGPKISDAHLAALAIEHGVILASADRDFRVFDGLQLINPLKQN
jgi:toxin-antitoxin system PIN domain toxin